MTLNEIQLLKLVRHYIYKYFLEQTRAPLVEDIMAHFQLPKHDVLGILEQLQEQHHLALLPGVPRILMAWPYSNIPTPWQVTTAEGKTYFANCAWDAIAFYVILQQEITIDSYCVHCGDLIQLIVKKTQLIKKKPEGLLIHFNKPIAQWMTNVIDTCGNSMNFFSDKSHLQEWQDQHSDFSGYTLTEHQIMEFSKLIYTNRAELEYVRPNTEKMKAFLQSVGLEGNFWVVDSYH